MKIYQNVDVASYIEGQQLRQIDKHRQLGPTGFGSLLTKRSFSLC